MRVDLREDQSTPNPDDAAIMAARGDYMSDSLVGKHVDEAMDGTDRSKAELIEKLLRSGHFGPFEHAQAVFHVEGISRAAMAQITRHRHFSFDVQSQRYVDFSDKEPVVPPSVKDSGLERSVELTMRASLWWYNRLIQEGVPKEDARFLLPLSTPVNMTFSANSRALMHFLDLRHNMKAQWEIRELAGLVFEECKEWAPLTFEGYEKHVNNNSLRAP
jgi:thymidylate synthase (FAD)